MQYSTNFFKLCCVALLKALVGLPGAFATFHGRIPALQLICSPFKMTAPYNLLRYENVFQLVGGYVHHRWPVASRHILAFKEHTDVVNIKNAVMACSCPCM